jgi:hypothetical protein
MDALAEESLFVHVLPRNASAAKMRGKGGNPGHDWHTEEYKAVLESYRVWMQNPTRPPVEDWQSQLASPNSFTLHYMMGVKGYWEDLCAQIVCKLSWDLLLNLPLKKILLSKS